MASVHCFTRELGLKHAEFFRSLPAAIDHHAYALDGSTVTIDYGDRRVTIELGPQMQRRIASLTLPYAEVRFCFHDFSTVQRAAFMQRFDLYFRRGGG